MRMTSQNSDQNKTKKKKEIVSKGSILVPLNLRSIRWLLLFTLVSQRSIFALVVDNERERGRETERGSSAFVFIPILFIDTIR